MEPTTPSLDLTGVDLGGVLDGIVNMIPIVLPVVVGFIAFRKGLQFVKGQIKGA